MFVYIILLQIVYFYWTYTIPTQTHSTKRLTNWISKTTDSFRVSTLWKFQRIQRRSWLQLCIWPLQKWLYKLSYILLMLKTHQKIKTKWRWWTSDNHNQYLVANDTWTVMKDNGSKKVVTTVTEPLYLINCILEYLK